MKFQTEIPIQKQSRNLIDYQSKILLIGSCFSENIGNKLSHFKFQTNQNPFGILFHPKAIERLITKAINQETYTEKDIFFHNERWHCFDAHSSLSSSNKDELLNSLNSTIQQAYESLKNVSHFIITLGTSWVYREITSDSIVANCHKIPQKKFLKELLSVQKITETLDAINTLIRAINPKASIIYTVSPVRHIKDGFIENKQSKAHLLASIHSVVEPRKNIHYFPSYEIMMDELRDYRFYNEDMIHPNSTAINYIWEKFTQAWFSENSFQTMKEIDTIQKGITHRPFNPNSEAHQTFLKRLHERISKIKTLHPNITF